MDGIGTGVDNGDTYTNCHGELELLGWDVALLLVEKFVPAARYKTKLKPGQKLPRVANMDVPAFQTKMDISDDLVDQFGIQIN